MTNIQLAFFSNRPVSGKYIDKIYFPIKNGILYILYGPQIKSAKYYKDGKEGSLASAISDLSRALIDAEKTGVLHLESWWLYDLPPAYVKTKEKSMKIRIKPVDPKYMPKKISKGDWIDLRAHGSYFLRAGDQQFIMLGVSMELPEGYEAIIAPRSSTYKNFGIVQTNAPGIIDNSFKGDDDEWGFSALAMKDTVVKDGDRICQFRIQKNQPPIEFEEVETLGNPSRGGWGSTGKR